MLMQRNDLKFYHGLAIMYHTGPLYDIFHDGTRRAKTKTQDFTMEQDVHGPDRAFFEQQHIKHNNVGRSCLNSLLISDSLGYAFTTPRILLETTFFFER